MDIITNNYSRFTGTIFGTFTSYGKEITKLLSKYPISNNAWHVYGEEFISSADDLKGEEKLLDPWLRLFPEKYINDTKTIDIPERHIKIETSVENKVYTCNVYIKKLRSVEITCKCNEEDNCLECRGLFKKTIFYP